MFFGKFPEGLLCPCLRDGVDKKPAARVQCGLICEGVPVLVGQRCLNNRVGEIYNSGNTSGEGDTFDTGRDSLADDVECALPGTLRTVGVSWRSGDQGDNQPRGYP